MSVLCYSSTDSGVVKQEIVYVQYLKDGLHKTDFAGINPSDKMDAKELLPATETVIKSLKPQDKQLDENTYLNEIYKKFVNVNFVGASIMSGNNSEVQARMKQNKVLFILTVLCIILNLLYSIL